MDKFNYIWTFLHENLVNSRIFWGRFRKILGSEGVDFKTYCLLYHVILYDLIIYESYTWVIFIPMIVALAGINAGFT